jgi:L-ascorbate metabolism protein UlaG (beta-lactamase superfamily)
MGDVGNPLTDAQMEALAGTDILLALAGGPPTIELEDLNNIIQQIKPKVVIPMHYRTSGPRFFMLPETDFTGSYPENNVVWSDSTEVEFNKESLPEDTRILVLKPTLFKDE